MGSDKTLRIAFLPLRRSTLPASGKVSKPFQGGFLSRMTADESFCEHSFIIYVYIHIYICKYIYIYIYNIYIYTYW